MDYNPFLLSMPVVTMVVNVRTVDGVDVEGEETDCVRQWGCIGNAFHGEETIERIQVSKRARNDAYARDNLKPY